MQLQDQQRDRDREDAVAEGDDPGELDVLAAPAKVALSLLRFDAGMIGAGADGTRPWSTLRG
jgi:hypothetical protein